MSDKRRRRRKASDDSSGEEDEASITAVSFLTFFCFVFGLFFRQIVQFKVLNQASNYLVFHKDYVLQVCQLQLYYYSETIDKLFDSALESSLKFFLSFHPAKSPKVGIKS